MLWRHENAVRTVEQAYVFGHNALRHRDPGPESKVPEEGVRHAKQHPGNATTTFPDGIRRPLPIDQKLPAPDSIRYSILLCGSRQYLIEVNPFSPSKCSVIAIL